MKTAAFIFLIVISLFSGPVAAFHSGGVAYCGACHVMHNQDNGIAYGANGRPHLLNDDSPTAICLSCHADQNGAVLTLDPLAPSPERGPGNFVFLYEDNINDGEGGIDNPIGGYAAGHSIVEPSLGLESDPIYSTAPGGTFPSGNLSCTSCHDPHGNQNFRMLRGAGPISEHGQGPPYNFAYPAPQAVGLPLASRISETSDNHTAYISGMSNWCANCHGQYHDLVGAQNFQHEFNVSFGEEQIGSYNSYNGIEDSLGGDPGQSYIPEVSFEDYLATVNQTSGPTVSSRVTCLTCHRAHASSSPAAGRWDFKTLFLDLDGLQSGSYPIPSPYNGYQEPPLCRKCHSETPTAPALLDQR